MPLYHVTATKVVTLHMYVLADNHDHADQIAEESFEDELTEVVEPDSTFNCSTAEVSSGDEIAAEWVGCPPYGERKSARFVLGKTWEGEPDR